MVETLNVPVDSNGEAAPVAKKKTKKKASSKAKAPAKAESKNGLNKPMVQVLGALTKLKNPTRSKVNSFLFAKTDKPNRRVSDMAGTYGGLVKMKYVKEHKLGGPGEEVHETVYEITSAGRKAYQEAK